jgi:hypothetical protein
MDKMIFEMENRKQRKLEFKEAKLVVRKKNENIKTQNFSEEKMV